MCGFWRTISSCESLEECPGLVDFLPYLAPVHAWTGCVGLANSECDKGSSTPLCSSTYLSGHSPCKTICSYRWHCRSLENKPLLVAHSLTGGWCRLLRSNHFNALQILESLTQPSPSVHRTILGFLHIRVNYSQLRPELERTRGMTDSSWVAHWRSRSRNSRWRAAQPLQFGTKSLTCPHARGVELRTFALFMSVHRCVMLHCDLCFVVIEKTHKSVSIKVGASTGIVLLKGRVRRNINRLSAHSYPENYSFKILRLIIMSKTHKEKQANAGSTR